MSVNTKENLFFIFILYINIFYTICTIKLLRYDIELTVTVADTEPDDTPLLSLGNSVRLIELPVNWITDVVVTVVCWVWWWRWCTVRWPPTGFPWAITSLKWESSNEWSLDNSCKESNWFWPRNDLRAVSDPNDFIADPNNELLDADMLITSGLLIEPTIRLALAGRIDPFDPKLLPEYVSDLMMLSFELLDDDDGCDALWPVGVNPEPDNWDDLKFGIWVVTGADAYADSDSSHSPVYLTT